LIPLLLILSQVLAAPSDFTEDGLPYKVEPLQFRGIRGGYEVSLNGTVQVTPRVLCLAIRTFTDLGNEYPDGGVTSRLQPGSRPRN
jgi:hypothetical protein